MSKDMQSKIAKHCSEQEQAEERQTDLVEKLTSAIPDTPSMQQMLKDNAKSLESKVGAQSAAKLDEMRKTLEDSIPNQLRQLDEMSKYKLCSNQEQAEKRQGCCSAGVHTDLVEKLASAIPDTSTSSMPQMLKDNAKSLESKVGAQLAAKLDEMTKPLENSITNQLRQLDGRSCCKKAEEERQYPSAALVKGFVREIGAEDTNEDNQSSKNICKQASNPTPAPTTAEDAENDVVAAAATLTKEDVHWMRSWSNPADTVRQAVKLFAMLLGEKDTQWENVWTLFMSERSLRGKLTSFDAIKLTQSQRENVETMLKTSVFTDDSLCETMNEAPIKIANGCAAIMNYEAIKRLSSQPRRHVPRTATAPTHMLNGERSRQTKKGAALCRQSTMT